jgi:hypothetical protein
MVIAHHKARPDLPVAIRWPESMPARATYRIDRDAVRSSHGARYSGPLPVTFRCRVLPDDPEAPKPDGRCVLPLPDGTVETSYWCGGKLHRHGAEGPALAIAAPGGEVLVELYAEEGSWHRDPAEGPAIFDVNFNMSGVRREEYWLHGVKHRLSAEGPAVIETDAAGNRILEIYIEHGLRHRDPSAGPAWHGFENGLQVWEYTVRGELHRDDGPAVIGRDPQGRIVRQEFWESGLRREEAARPPNRRARRAAKNRPRKRRVR